MTIVIPSSTSSASGGSGMTFLQMAQAAKRESGLGSGPVSVDTSSGDDARFFHWVAWAWRDIDLLHEGWSWRRGSADALTNGTRVLSATSDFNLSDFGSWLPASREYQPSTYKTSDGVSTERPLRFVEYDSFRALFSLGTHTSAPIQVWTVAPNGDFLVGPTPDAEHFVRAEYIKDHVPMSADDDEPALPTRFHMLIVWRALREYGGYDAASEVWQRADGNFKTMMPALSQACLPRMRWSGRPL
jgi:hypothetical protein